MPKHVMAVLALALIALVLSVAGVLHVPRLVPEALFAFALILVLLNVINESDQKPL